MTEVNERNPIVDLGEDTINLFRVVRVSAIFGEPAWQRYTLYFEDGNSINVYESRLYDGNNKLNSMKREVFISLWKKVFPAQLSVTEVEPDFSDIQL
jgi:hypothetical protein